MDSFANVYTRESYFWPLAIAKVYIPESLYPYPTWSTKIKIISSHFNICNGAVIIGFIDRF